MCFKHSELSLSEAIEYARKPVNYTFEEAISDDFQDDYATEILKPLDELSKELSSQNYPRISKIRLCRRGSVAATTNKVVKAAGKKNSTTSVPGSIPKIPKPVHELSQLIQVRAENGLGPTTNNTEKTSLTRVPVSVPQIQGPAHAASLSQLIQGAALTVRPENEMENGFRAIHQQHKENLINIITSDAP
ncbi:hypothetical protein DAPPUDRAFT_250591 [Daphnia pulex]|uniref:Uncharacterized protein n=1 Tax=Daphnia pulex TaxID=6669 RepID=E9GYW5_DAPPU|nr:hypothetical protein DAPPUDRAFT_250591 [Daphnia pulex]|eukprot:EFX75336.1 hypothetical protein DAPPUDRAFT_250591 [Daphnia pulex]